MHDSEAVSLVQIGAHRRLARNPPRRSVASETRQCNRERNTSYQVTRPSVILPARKMLPASDPNEKSWPSSAEKPRTAGGNRAELPTPYFAGKDREWRYPLI